MATVPGNLCILLEALIFSTLFMQQLSWASLDHSVGYCGLAPYDITNETIKRHGLNLSDPAELRRFALDNVPAMYRPDWPAEETSGNNASPEELVAYRRRQAYVQLTLFPIRIRVLYDKSFAAQHSDPSSVERFVRNMMYAVQLIFEQPELYLLVKVQIVVVQIAKLDRDFPVEESANEMLNSIDSFNLAANQTENFDLTLMIMYRSIFESTYKGNVLNGLAGLGSFCSSKRSDGLVSQKGLVVEIKGINRVMVLAHELAHNLGVPHDGVAQSTCEDGKFIMSRFANEGRVKWSECSREMMAAHIRKPHVFECVYNQDRLRSAVPISQQFDWFPGRPGRVPLPGEEVTLDKQCQLATDNGARALPKPFTVGNGTSFEVCQVLRCVVDHNLVDIGPALTGSECISRSGLVKGRCFYGECLIPKKGDPV